MLIRSKQKLVRDNMSDEVTKTIDGLLEEKVSRAGDATLFNYQGESFTYQKVNDNVNRIASSLHEEGVGPGDIVCIYMYNRPEYIYTLFALSKLGAISAPIDTRFSGSTLVSVLSDSDAHVLILDSDTKATYDEVRNDVPNISTEYFVGNSYMDNPYHSFDQLNSGGEAEFPRRETDGSDIFSVLYINRYQKEHPKGVQMPHYSYINTAQEAAESILNLDESDCVFTTLPFYNIYPIQVGLLGSVVSGAEFAFEKRFKCSPFWDWIATYEATTFLYLGRMLAVLYNQSQLEDVASNPVKYALGHGWGFDTDKELITQFEQRFDITVLEAYGITPAMFATSNRPSDRKYGSVGRPASYVDLKIVDENDWEVDTNETGEIVIRSNKPNTVMQGFHNDQGLVAEVCRNQWIHTNDVGYIDSEGYLHFVANKRNTIHVGRVSAPISSLEIESVIDSHPDVNESFVLGISDETGTEEIKAVVVPNEEDSVTPIDIFEYAKQQLTYHKLPRYIEIRTQLPRSPTGKVCVDELRRTKLQDGVWNRKSGYDLSR